MTAYLPKFKPGQAVTFTASADVVGGRIVEVTGDRQVAHAAAASGKVVGVAGFDVASGDSVTVFSGGVQRLTAASAIAAGDRVAAAATGKAAPVTASEPALGIALEAGSAEDVVDVQML